MIEILYGARLFDGHRFLDDRALIHDGRTILDIAAVADRPFGPAALDLGGGTLAPGLVDVQINGGGGVLFNDTPTPEAIRTIGEAHRRHGTTSFLPTVITDRPEILDAALAAARACVGVVPGCLGIHVEGPFIDPRRAGAHPPDLIRRMTPADADLLVAARAGVMLVTLAPASVDNATVARLAAAGVIVSLGHSEASDAEARAAFEAGASAVTHLFNAMSQLGHRAPGLVGAGLTEAGVICGLIADGHHVADAALKIAIAAKGPAGIALISDAMPPAAGGPDEFQLGDRRACRRNGRLELDDGTLAGADITLLDAVRYVRGLGVPLETALQMATTTPLNLLGLDGKPAQLAVGSPANMIHLDRDLGLTRVWTASSPGA